MNDHSDILSQTKGLFEKLCFRIGAKKAGRRAKTPAAPILRPAGSSLAFPPMLPEFGRIIRSWLSA
jgi:hypothetical protein